MPTQHAKNLQMVYAQVADEYDHKHSDDADLEQIETLFNLLPQNADILDLGAGNGRDSRIFVDRGYRVTMLDFSGEMLAIAHQKVPEAKIIQADMLDIDLGWEKYDGIWASASLLHLTKVELPIVLKKILRSLRSDGIFYVKVKEGEGEKELTQSKYSQNEEKISRFFSLYQSAELRKFLADAGFVILTEKEKFYSDKTQKWLAMWAKKQT